MFPRIVLHPFIQQIISVGNACVGVNIANVLMRYVQLFQLTFTEIRN